MIPNSAGGIGVAARLSINLSFLSHSEARASSKQKRSSNPIGNLNFERKADQEVVYGFLRHRQGTPLS